jgi:pSer/pThr/pTyr-binding forkhead associated (FHA) protein
VGRSPYCSIVLSNSQSSRQHCALRLDGEVLSVVDLNSANGTWVNDARIAEPQKLDAGDVIRIGTDVLEVLPAQEINGERPRQTTSQRETVDLRPGKRSRAVGPEEPQTETATRSLELLEALVASVSQTRRPYALAPTVQRTVDTIIKEQTQDGRRITGADATRLAAVIERLTSWCPEELGQWREHTLATISARPGDEERMPVGDVSQ